VPTDGVFPLARSYDCAGPMARTVADCAQAMETLVPGFGPVEPAELDGIRAGVAWLELADPFVRARVADAAAAFRRPADIELEPLPKETYAVFMREAADVHRELFAEHRDLYGDNVRTKIERCLAVTDDEYERGLGARERYRARALAALGEVELLVVPTLTFVAPRAGTPELELREAMIRLTYPFSALGWPAVALPCGTAEDGLPASVSLVGRPGADALVLGAGLALEGALARS
jgi:Asp-tRNA(Asn)/Glu-tRNA(Gln) amidotransferase A subunit family amidase